MNFENKSFSPKPLDVKLKRNLRRDSNFSLKKYEASTNLEKSFTLFETDTKCFETGYRSENSKSGFIDFKDVVNALNNSSKGKLNYPEPIYEETSELCNLKYIGDLKHSSFSSYNTFRESQSLSEEDETESDDDVDGKEGNNEVYFNQRRSCDDASSEEDLEDVEVLNLQLLISDIKLRQERTLTKQIQILHHHDNYISKLEEIRQTASKDLEIERRREKEKREEEIERLEQLEMAATHQALIAEEEYRQQSQQREVEILQEIEAMKHQEVERQLSIQKLQEVVQENYNNFRNVWDVVKTDIRNYADLSIEPQVETHLESICVFLETCLSCGEGTNESELKEGQNYLRDATEIVNTLSAFIDQKKEQDLARQQADIETAKSAPPPPPPQQQQQEVPPPPIQPPQSKQDKLNAQLSKLLENYLNTKSKCESIYQQAVKIKEKPQMRPLLSRAIAIVNQISNQSFDSSNRNTLQQIVNLLGGSTASVGDISVSIQNDPIAEAFVIDQLSTNLISLSHDKQVGALPIYASFIMKLWDHFPLVGEIILHKLYETCPFLVPLVIKKKENQSEAEYNRSLGFRHKDGGSQEAIDKYLNRMGSCARLYGRIVSMDLEKHPHGLENGWKFIAVTLSLPPMPSITTSLLFGFLSVAGNALIRSYGKQFRKVLNFICSDYLALIKQDTLEGGDSDVHSLTKLLEEYLKSGTIPPPKEGYRSLI